MSLGTRLCIILKSARRGAALAARRTYETYDSLTIIKICHFRMLMLRASVSLLFSGTEFISRILSTIFSLSTELILLLLNIEIPPSRFSMPYLGYHLITHCNFHLFYRDHSPCSLSLRIPFISIPHIKNHVDTSVIEPLDGTASLLN